MYKNPNNEEIKDRIAMMNRKFISHMDAIGNTYPLRGGCGMCESESDSDKEAGVRKYKKQSVKACGGSGFASGTFMDSGFGKVVGAGKRVKKEKKEKKVSEKEALAELLGKGVPEQKVVERSVMKGSTMSGGKKEKKKEPKKETEWMRVVKETRDKMPGKGLKEVIAYIKANNLYKKK
jgi:hypothetical protein